MKVALGNRGTTVEAARQCEWRAESPGTYVTDRVSRGHFFFGPVFFRTELPCSGGYHLERSGMPLHDAVGINFKECATAGNQGADVKYMG